MLCWNSTTQNGGAQHEEGAAGHESRIPEDFLQDYGREVHECSRVAPRTNVIAVPIDRLRAPGARGGSRVDTRVIIRILLRELVVSKSRLRVDDRRPGGDRTPRPEFQSIARIRRLLRIRRSIECENSFTRLHAVRSTAGRYVSRVAIAKL